jgi:ApaG protein
MSDTVTHGIRVRARPVFHPERSSPERRYWFFSYTIEISNLGPAPVQLLSRHWWITDGTGRVEEVEGPGVIGQTPVIAPGSSFVYTSFCPLPTPVGAMQGTYTMRRQDGTTFDAAIGTFVLEDPESVN